MKKSILPIKEKEIMNRFSEWLINDYQTRLGHVSKSSINHRKQQIQWLLSKPASQYGVFDRKCMRHSINRFIQFGATLKGNKNKAEYLNMMNKITKNINC